MALALGARQSVGEFEAAAYYALRVERVWHELIVTHEPRHRCGLVALHLCMQCVKQLGDGSFAGLGSEYKRVEDVYDAIAAAESKAKGSKGPVDGAGGEGGKGGGGAAGGSAFARPLIWQIHSLMRRSYTNTLRDPDFGVEAASLWLSRSVEVYQVRGPHSNPPTTRTRLTPGGALPWAAVEGGGAQAQPQGAGRARRRGDRDDDHVHVQALVGERGGQLVRLPRRRARQGQSELGRGGGPGGAACGSSLERGRPSSLQVAGLPSR